MGDAREVRQGLLRADVVVAGEQIAGVVLTLDRRESLIGPRWIDRGDILFGGRSEGVCVGAADMRCESRPDRFQSWTSGLDGVPVATGQEYSLAQLSGLPS